MKYDNLYLRKRPQFDQLVDYIEYKQPKIKYPNRFATFFRNSPYGSQFDGDNSFINLEEQENNIMKQKILQETIRQMASETGQTHTVLKATGTQTYETKSTGTQPTEYFDMSKDDGDDINSEAERRAEEEMKKQEKAKDLFSEATQKDDLRPDIIPEVMTATKLEKREASQEATPARDKKTKKGTHTWHKSYRSRSPLRADPAETEKINRRISKKTTPPPPTDTLPTVPPPVPPPKSPPPPKSTKGESSSSSKYPTLNKEAAKEKVGGTIKLKQKGPTGAAAAAADAYEDDDDDDAAAGVYNIRPSVIGIQVLREILENASNKRRLSWDDEVRYTRAINRFAKAVKEKDKLEKDKAIQELRAIYKNSFYKQKLL